MNIKEFSATIAAIAALHPDAIIVNSKQDEIADITLTQATYYPAKTLGIKTGLVVRLEAIGE